MDEELILNLSSNGIQIRTPQEHALIIPVSILLQFIGHVTGSLLPLVPETPQYHHNTMGHI